MMHPTLLSVLASVILLSCTPFAIHGTGDAYRVSHPISPLTTVEISGNGELRIQNGDRNELIILAQDEIHQHLSIRQQGQRLIIEPEDGYHLKPDDTLRYLVITNAIEKLDLRGALSVTSDIYRTPRLTIETSGAIDLDMTLDTEELRLDASGAFDGRLVGRTQALTLDFSGASELDAFDMNAEHVRVDAAGAASLSVSARETLEVSAAGASQVIYRGRPRVSQSAAGASSVRGEN